MEVKIEKINGLKKALYISVFKNLAIELGCIHL
jgi:hypothetical protein